VIVERSMHPDWLFVVESGTGFAGAMTTRSRFFLTIQACVGRAGPSPARRRSPRTT
jgi:hypothetical protein